MGWQFGEKYALHEQFGDAFMLVTPSTNELVLADPDATTEVLGHRKEFPKPTVVYKQLDIFGPSVNTVEGDTWQRHRKITAPSFNERTSSSVWSEAVQQAVEMLQGWLQRGHEGTKETVGDTALLALHVLTYAGFGMKYSYSSGVQRPQPGFTMAYRDALSMVLRNVIILFIVPRSFLRLSFMPKKLRDVGQATKEFQTYMEEMLARERQLISKRVPGQGNLMSALIRASEEAKELGEDESVQGLQDEEIFGNIFIYNLAGHETTANAVAFAIVLLAAYPEWQDWIAEEIEFVFGSGQTNKAGAYEAAFPRLRRCLAIMFETLRLYGSVVFIPKTTGFHSQVLAFHQNDYTLPPNTSVTINVQGLHTNPRTWGSNALMWHPKRWIINPTEGNLESETMMEPTKGTFVPWADGPRVCPGRKVAQVEFVAVMATLFQSHRVSPALLEGESHEHARGRLVDMVNDSGISAITLQMQHPKNASLVWTRKAK